MNFIGKWKLEKIQNFDSENEEYVTPEEYMELPLPVYVDTDDEEEVKHEMKQRKMMVDAVMEIADDNIIYMLSPIPEGVTQEMIDKEVADGNVSIRDGMMVIETYSWEDRNGELFFDSGVNGEIAGEKIDSWVNPIDEDGKFRMVGTIYSKVE